MHFHILVSCGKSLCSQNLESLCHEQISNFVNNLPKLNDIFLRFLSEKYTPDRALSLFHSWFQCCQHCLKAENSSMTFTCLLLGSMADTSIEELTWPFFNSGGSVEGAFTGLSKKNYSKQVEIKKCSHIKLLSSNLHNHIITSR